MKELNTVMQRLIFVIPLLMTNKPRYASSIFVLHDESKAMAKIMCTKDISKSGKFIGETVHRELFVKYAGEPIILMKAKSIQSYVNKFRSAQYDVPL